MSASRPPGHEALAKFGIDPKQNQQEWPAPFTACLRNGATQCNATRVEKCCIGLSLTPTFKCLDQMMSLRPVNVSYPFRRCGTIHSL